MALARLDDGRIIMHNAIALDQESMARIDAWGQVAAIVIPNAFHRQDAAIMQARYPKAKVYAPRGALKAASKATPCAGTYGELPSDATVTAREIVGIGEREGVLLMQSPDGVSAIFCDTVLNLPKLSGLAGFALHPSGMLSVPRATRWVFTKDKRALSKDLLSIAETNGLVRIIPGHGNVVTSNAAEGLREVAQRLARG